MSAPCPTDASRQLGVQALHRHNQHAALLPVCPLSALVRGSHSFQEATDLLVLKFPRKKKTKISAFIWRKSQEYSFNIR